MNELHKLAEVNPQLPEEVRELLDEDDAMILGGAGISEDVMRFYGPWLDYASLRDADLLGHASCPAGVCTLDVLDVGKFPGYMLDWVYRNGYDIWKKAADREILSRGRRGAALEAAHGSDYADLVDVALEANWETEFQGWTEEHPWNTIIDFCRDHGIAGAQDCDCPEDYDAWADEYMPEDYSSGALYDWAEMLARATE